MVYMNFFQWFQKSSFAIMFNMAVVEACVIARVVRCIRHGGGKVDVECWLSVGAVAMMSHRIG